MKSQVGQNGHQEKFWSGDFGNEYTDRNKGQSIVDSNGVFFSRALNKTSSVPQSILELGANCGLNMLALKKLYPACSLTAVELNEKAFESLKEIPGVNAICGSLYEAPAEGKFELVFTKGVLIHLNPERLAEAYDRLYNLSSRYVLVAEYYSPSPQEISYRGNQGVLFKRDFAGEMLDRFSDLKLLDYGFSYRRDAVAPQDDLTWFLMERK